MAESAQEPASAHPSGAAEPLCPQCLKFGLETAQARFERDEALAALASAQQELELWKVCVNCHQPLAAPGHCASAAKEHETGQDQMIAELLDMRDGYRAERDSAQAQIAKERRYVEAGELELISVKTQLLEAQAQIAALTAEQARLHEVIHRHNAKANTANESKRRSRKYLEAKIAVLTARAEQAGGVAMIAAERQRQKAVEGWTPEHDATHDQGEMIEGARGYLSAAFLAERGRRWIGSPPPTWPWNTSWWKPSADPIRNLVKAGALIAAEIDRVLAASTPAADTPTPQE